MPPRVEKADPEVNTRRPAWDRLGQSPGPTSLSRQREGPLDSQPHRTCYTFRS